MFKVFLVAAKYNREKKREKLGKIISSFFPAGLVLCLGENVLWGSYLYVSGL